LDRSLGRLKVPALLREASLRLTTLSEYYGVPADERVSDQEWLELAGQRGWVVFMKDNRIRYNRAEREAVRTYGVRASCLSSQSLTAEEMSARFLGNLARITLACQDAGPFIYAVHKNRIEKLDLGTD
jgi:hypothetical protein